MSPLEILALALLGGVLVGRLRSPIVRGSVIRARRAPTPRSFRPAGPARAGRGSAGQPAPRAA
jgi:hypothetical protein